MNLGQKIYELRTAKNLSQGDLADLLDVSRQSVSKWENDSAVPELDKLIKLCNVFDITLDELTGRTQPASKTSVLTPPHSTAFTTQKVAGYILLTFALLTSLLLARFAADLFMFILVVQPLLLSSLVCLRVRKCAGYWCLWAVFLSLEFFFPFVMGLSILKATYVVRLVFLVIMFFVAWAMFKDVTIYVTKKHRYLTLLGWIAYIAASWITPRIFYAYPSRLWFNSSDLGLLQSYLYYAVTVLLAIGLAALLAYTVCLLHSQKQKL